MTGALFALLLAPPQDDVCHIELSGFEARASRLNSETRVEGVAVNRSPSELGSVSVEVTLVDEKGVRVKAMPRATFARMAPRRGVSVSVAVDEIISAASFRVRVVYFFEGKERAFEFEEDRLAKAKLYEEPGPGTRFGPWGLRVVKGGWRKVGQKLVPNDDTLFLRVKIDGLDDKARPEGALDITLNIDGKKQGTLKRQVTPAHFKIDSKIIPADDADPRILCYDAHARELLVGLCRVKDDVKLGQISLEASFTWNKQKWTWAAMEYPWVEAPRPPDKKSP